MSSLSLPPSVPEAFPFRDKGIHFVEYAVLGLLVGFATRRSWPGAGALRTQLLALVICAGWGVLDELHQAFVPGRASDLRDGVADILGASVGLFVEALGSRLLRRTP